MCHTVYRSTEVHVPHECTGESFGCYKGPEEDGGARFQVFVSIQVRNEDGGSQTRLTFADDY